MGINGNDLQQGSCFPQPLRFTCNRKMVVDGKVSDTLSLLIYIATLYLL